jgi:hypothetical protein
MFKIESESIVTYETVLARLSMTGIARGDVHDSQRAFSESIPW